MSSFSRCHFLSATVLSAFGAGAAPTGISVAEAEAAISALTCPICGCRLAG